MTKIVLVGEKPSNKNISPYVPFVGAKCFNRLVDWIKYLDPDYYVVYNSNMPIDIRNIESLSEARFKIIALGKAASKTLKKIEHYTIDHPSGLNRKLNDVDYVQKMLDKCKEYIDDPTRFA